MQLVWLALRTEVAPSSMRHVRGRPYQTVTQGNVEHSHRLMKNQVKLEDYNFPGDLKARIAEFVNYHNTERRHESGTT
jgi:hypothetical protein